MTIEHYQRQWNLRQEISRDKVVESKTGKYYQTQTSGILRQRSRQITEHLERQYSGI